MAHVEPSLLFDLLRGKLYSRERIVLRTRNGRTHAYAIMHPYTGPLAESRKRAISTFSQAVKQCKIEMADPERLAFWQEQYAQYIKLARRNTVKANRQFVGTNTDKYYATLRGFIIAAISVQLRAE